MFKSKGFFFITNCVKVLLIGYHGENSIFLGIEQRENLGHNKKLSSGIIFRILLNFFGLQTGCRDK